MTDSDVERALANPLWTSLTTRHAHLAQGGSLARRYPVDISPLMGLPAEGPANVAALQSLVDIGDDMAVVGPIQPMLPRNWETLYQSQLTQMIRTDRSLLPEGNADASTLGVADVPDMLALVELTRPGPFRMRTIELGRYIGIRIDGKLLAIAGERSWIGNFHEVSAICTHPEARGNGYARAMIAHIVNRMLRTGETPFLHVESSNAAAIALYCSVGFMRRVEYPLLVARRVA